MAFEAKAFSLGPCECETLRTIANHEPISAELLSNMIAVNCLIEKGFVEKVRQELAGIDRYRLTNSGRIKYRQLSVIRL